MSRASGRAENLASRYPSRYRFLLDADLSPEVARVSRAMGLDVVSVYECGRGELRDDEQLHLAAADERIFVTGNRKDFLRWTAEFARTREPHAGVLIVTRAVAATSPEPLTRALDWWAELMTERFAGAPIGPYFLDFLSAPPLE